MDSNSTDKDILYSLEKIAQAQNFYLWEIAKEEKLSPLQIKFIEYIKNNLLENCTVSNLSIEFDIKKPTVSDSIKNLFQKGLIQKIPDKNDKRIYYIKLTDKIIDIINEIDRRNKNILQLISTIPQSEKNIVSGFLIKLIKSYYQSGIIQKTKICLGCHNFKSNSFPGSVQPHYCQFTKLKMSENDIKINCKEFSKKESEKEY